MFIGILRFYLEDWGDSPSTKETSALCQQVRSRFKAVAKARWHNGEPEITIACLDENSERLTHHLQTIVDFCENTGIGRLDRESILVEAVELLLDEDAC